MQWNVKFDWESREINKILNFSTLRVMFKKLQGWAIMPICSSLWLDYDSGVEELWSTVKFLSKTRRMHISMKFSLKTSRWVTLQFKRCAATNVENMQNFKASARLSNHKLVMQTRLRLGWPPHKECLLCKAAVCPVGYGVGVWYLISDSNTVNLHPGVKRGARQPRHYLNFKVRRLAFCLICSKHCNFGQDLRTLPHCVSALNGLAWWHMGTDSMASWSMNGAVAAEDSNFLSIGTNSEFFTTNYIPD